MSLRFIHAADLHLGSPARGVRSLPESVRKRLLEAPYRAFAMLVQTAVTEQVDFVLLAGDIFDQANPSIKARVRLMEGLSRLGEAGINFFIFSDHQVERIPFYKEGKLCAAIYGISYATPQVTENLAIKFKRDGEEPVAIGLLHTNCGGIDGHDHYAPSTVGDLLQAGFDYWALGHVHTRQVMHQYPFIVYPGSLQGRHINEQGARGFYVVEVADNKTIRLHFKEAAFVRWETCPLPLTGVHFWDELHQKWLSVRERLCQEADEELVMVRIVGEGQTPLADELVREEVRNEWADLWRQDALEESPLIWPESFQFKGSRPYDRNRLQKSGTWYADLLEIIDHYRSNDEQLMALAREVLAELYSHPRAKRYLTALSKEEMVALLQEAEQLIVLWTKGGQDGEDQNYLY
jgi:DNA repair exonuclease SbcCD nuclease subunit